MDGDAVVMVAFITSITILGWVTMKFMQSEDLGAGLHVKHLSKRMYALEKKVEDMARPPVEPTKHPNLFVITKDEER